MSRYPTTAELAAFRRDVERSTRGGLRVAIFDDVMSRPAGAIDYERRAGIGHPGSALDRALYTDARRESSALRSRAYRAAFGRVATDAAAWPGNIATTADIAAHQAFEPR